MHQQSVTRLAGGLRAKPGAYCASPGLIWALGLLGLLGACLGLANAWAHTHTLAHKGIGVFDDAMLLQVAVREDRCNYWYNICRMIGVAVGNTEMGEGAGVRLTTRAREDADDDVDHDERRGGMGKRAQLISEI